MDPITRLNEALAARYQIVREIGAGGMATVYLARDLKHDRNVALKVLKPELGAVLGIDRFLSEIKVTANLQHPNLLALFDSGEADGLLFYVMPFVEGESLRARLDREKQLPVEEAVRIAVAAASALAYAHEHGVIHRDLKPENILLQSGQPVIADFGIALAVSKAGGQRMTESGLSLGTPQYMSPEQAGADRMIDGRSDIYSLGAVTYEMLTGDAPHTGSTAQAILARVMTEQPRPVRASRASVPEHVELAIHIALAKLPADRFATAPAFADALQGRHSALSTAASAHGMRSPVRRPWTWAAIAALVIAAAVAIGRVSVRTPAPRVARLAVSIPQSQAYVDANGSAVVFTPDGSAIVYTGRGPQGTRLYYRRLDQMEGTALPGTDGAYAPAISPSGDWVAFTTDGPRRAASGQQVTTVSKVSLQGGAAIALADVETGGGLAWGPDDAIYAGTNGSLLRVPANGGAVRRIARTDSARHQFGLYTPMVMPDAKNVLVSSYVYSKGFDQPSFDYNIAVVRIADGKVTILDGDAWNPIGVVAGNLLFGRSDGTLGVAPFDPARTRSLRSVIPVIDRPLIRLSEGMFASVSATGDLVYVRASSLWRLTILDRQGRIIGGRTEEGDFLSPRISPDGRRIVMAARTDSSVHTASGGAIGDLWLHDVATGTLQRLTIGGNASAPEWTPDGRRIVYTLRPERGLWESWWAPADMSGPGERFLAMPIRIVQTVLSPDSRYAVVVAVDPKTKSDLYLVDLKGDKKPTPLEQSPFDETSPTVSPDGHWLAYTSNQSGETEVYVRPFPARGAHVQISVHGGGTPRWAKDARSIVYQSSGHFVRASLAVGANVTVTQRDSLFSGDFAPDFDLSSDGRIIALRSGTADAELVVVLNWIAELKARLARQ